MLKMNNNARERVLTNLRIANQAAPTEIPVTGQLPPLFTNSKEKINRLKELMEGVHTEIYLTPASQLITAIKRVLNEKEIKTLLFSPETKFGKELEKSSDKLPEFVPYSGNIESFKDELFQIDAAITTTVGGIADTGSLILWPTSAEPRLMSLVPPIHIAILEADKIYADFSEAIEKTNWVNEAPANALLISGPSKTADIELTLAYGVHGPKEVVVFIVVK
jgi:L-lactate dehydrogenase complex protein LldG